MPADEYQGTRGMCSGTRSCAFSIRSPFSEAYRKGKNIRDKRVYLAEYQKYVDQTVLYDKSYHISSVYARRNRGGKAARKQGGHKPHNDGNYGQGIEKQMRAVQEIASLLGETTAGKRRSRITKLKESLTHE
jgi:hypothetical protein